MNFISIKKPLVAGYQRKPHETHFLVNFDLVSSVRKDSYGKAILSIDGKDIETREDYDALLQRIS